MSRVPNVQLHPNDKYITRNRVGRVAVFALYTTSVPAICAVLGWKVAEDWFSFGIAGGFAGLAASIPILSLTLDRFFISVEMVSAFVTIDLLRTLLWGRGREIPDPETFDEESEEEKDRDLKSFPVYGPGRHFSFPWEERNQANNISLKEVSADIKFPVLLSDGTITLEGSYRIRPDFQNLIPFLSGVASTAEELEEIIASYAVEILSPKTVDEALGSVSQLNKLLNRKFGLKTDASPEGEEGTAPASAEEGDLKPDDKVSDFERRFGVYVGDITIAKILPSDEVQRTRGSITEARAIAEGTAILLGYKNGNALARARAKSKVTDEQISRARDRFLSISGNLQGMEVKRNEVDVNITGLDPETVMALGAAAALYTSALGKK